MKIYNTMTNRQEEFVPIEQGKVKMYVCGPTVYNYIHLGNARPIIVFDVLARYFKYRGYEVEYVQNFTDVDDKIIKRANEEGISPEEVTKKYIEGFFQDIGSLNVLSDIKRPKVTENMPEIIEIIERLINEGYAYEMEGNVFFDVKRYKDYGKLSNQKIDELEIGARVDIMEIKNNPLDFALWKKMKEGEPYWESPWGKGRPGWHIECSAMSRKYLGDTFDIHGGGQDLIFPHHENEIAQSRCSSCGDFARYWMHNGFVQVDGDKMSKSTGNFFLLREILEKFQGNVVRLFIIGTHYRKPVNFSMSNMEDSKNTFENIVDSMEKFQNVMDMHEKKSGTEEETSSLENNDEKWLKLKEYDRRFIHAMDDDMNTPQALSVIFDQIRETKRYINEKIKDENTLLSESEIFWIKESYKSLKVKLEDVLGLDLTVKCEKKNKKFEKNDKLTGNLIELLIKLRADARKEKNFSLSDEIRNRLKEMGISLKDSKEGTTSYTLDEE